MAQPLSGRNPLAYLGVEAVTPPNMIVSPTSPTPSDTKNVSVGDMWINRNTQAFYVLTSLAGGRATWTQVEGSSANQFETDDSHIAIPVGGLLVIHGGTGITTSSSGNTVTITATGGSGISTLDGDTGSATGSTVKLAGAGDITTSATGSTVTFTGSGVTTVNSGSGSATVSSNAITITGGSGITTSATGSTVTITASGGGGITTLDGDSGSATGSTVTITGGGNSNIGTASFTATGATVTLNPSPLTTGNTLSIGWGGNSLANLAGSLFNPSNCNALGFFAGNAITSGQFNCLFGTNTGQNITTGSSNCGFGNSSFLGIQTGSSNCAIGNNALGLFSGTASASFNIAIGDFSGSALRSSESSNIYLNSAGVISESNTLRIGSATGTSTQQLNASFIAGITGIVVTGAPVLISTSNQLGVASSSRRFKSDIQDMKDDSSALYKLRPVSFTWDKNSAPGLKDATDMRQYGLIAEEAAPIIPFAVNLDKEGRPLNINYQDLIGMMINEIQKLRKEVDVLKGGKV